MAGIFDPWHSRPIDVHRWSDHPEVAAIVEQIWQAHFQDMDGVKPGPKPKTPFKDQLKILILDCYVAWLEDTELSIGVSMNANAYDTGSRYNALRISKHILLVIHRLAEVGLLDIAKGSYSGAGAGGNRTTRIRPSETLQAIFGGSSVTRDDIRRIETEECVILRGADDRLIDYEDNEESNRQRDELRAYNRVLANSHIDLPGLDEPRLVTGQDRGRDTVQHIGRHYQFIRRVYSRGDWGCNGRFYGGWWQMVNSAHRQTILINDTPTVEVDFKALHVQILSAEKGIELEVDPYELPAGTVPGTPPALQRTLVKKLLLTALNARDRQAAFRSFRGEWPDGHMGKNMTDKELEQLVQAFLTRHPHLADCVFADQGIRLMNVDSQIAERVHRHFTNQGVPVLSVHDSFIVDYSRVGELKRVMAEASEGVVGKPLPVSWGGVGLDEVERDQRADLMQWREESVVRSEGYLARMQAWRPKVPEPAIVDGATFGES